MDLTYSTPGWLAGNPLIITGSWDTTPIFRIRHGADSPHFQAEYRQRYSPATVAAMKELGVTLAVVDFFKGFGLQAESEYAEGLGEFVAACKQSGIRIGAYVGSTLAYETMLVEVPDSGDWLVTDSAGVYLPYPGESFRARVYFMHPGYRNYIKRVLTATISDFGADEIHFDSASVMAEGPIFFHPRAVEDFRMFLRSRYSPARLKERLGFDNVDRVLPPRGQMNPITDPLFQEWAEFRCQMLADYFYEMRAHIRALNSEVAVSVNTVAAITEANLELGGVDHSRLLPLIDILWNEELCGVELRPAGMQDGVLVSKIRSYKMAAGHGKRMLTYTGGSGQSKLQLAEAMAYNRETLGMVGEPLNSLAFPEDQLPFVQFFRDNFECYRGVANVADVAVLWSFKTMTYNSARPRNSSLLFLQALIQDKILFDIVFDSELNDLSRYRVLVLASQECLDEAQMQAVRAFVHGGGGLVATEATSLYNELRQRRDTFGLADLFGPLPDPSRDEGQDLPLAIPIVRRLAGAGRVAYLPSVIPPPATLTAYALPENWKDLVDSVRWAAGDPLSLEVDAPLTVTTEMTRTEQGNRYFIHLVNYSPLDPVELIGVRFRIPNGKTLDSVEVRSPGSDQVQSLPFEIDGDFASWLAPKLETYAVMSVSLV